MYSRAGFLLCPKQTVKFSAGKERFSDVKLKIKFLLLILHNKHICGNASYCRYIRWQTTKMIYIILDNTNKG